jgi:hypothetical protein
MDYPTLSVPPSIELDEEYEDVRIRNSFESGAEQVRTRYTKARRTFTFRYDFLPTADKEELEDFYVDDLVQGTYTFTWVHPQSGDSYGVRFVNPPKFSYVLDTDGGWWKTEIVVREP